MTTLDTSVIFSLLNRKDKDHERVLQALRAAKPPFYVPSGILAEIAYLIEQRLEQRVLLAFLSDLQKGNFVLDCGENDMPRVEALVTRYETKIYHWV